MNEVSDKIGASKNNCFFCNKQYLIKMFGLSLILDKCSMQNHITL